MRRNGGWREQAAQHHLPVLEKKSPPSRNPGRLYLPDNDRQPCARKRNHCDANLTSDWFLPKQCSCILAQPLAWENLA